MKSYELLNRVVESGSLGSSIEGGIRWLLRFITKEYEDNETI